MRNLFIAVTIFTLVAVVQPTRAADVQFEVIAYEATNTFDLFATASVGDNFGIASYGVPLDGGILTVDHNSPNASFTDITLPAGPFTPVGGVGFDLLRTPNDQLFVSASQDTVTPNPLGMVYGFGQTGGDLITYAPPPVGDSVSASGDQIIYGSVLMLATGTCEDVDDIGFDTGSVDLGVNVFLDDAGTATAAAQFSTLVTIVRVPEPVTLGLAWLGLCGVLVIRRRRCA